MGKGQGGGLEMAGNIFLPGQGSGQAVTQGKQTNFENILEQWAREMYSQGGPLRDAFLKRGMGLMNGTQNVTDLPEYATLVNAADRQLGDQYGMARDQIVENTPVGASGVMQRGLQNAALGQAEQKGAIANQIASQLMQQYLGGAIDQAFGGQNVALGGIGAGADTFAKRWNQGVQAMMNTNSTAANFFGNLVGGKMGGGKGGGKKPGTNPIGIEGTDQFVGPTIPAGRG